ncbi:hypothetical protein [Microcoleus sp. B9-D4]|uniref:hypothetical protein n=1 Tax=Microcoleus sp. B9-D4 TaxID=2818711 RepID=UPI002FCEB9A7
MIVFFTGTEYIDRLNDEIKWRIQNVCRLNAEIVIGNYSGFDKLALQFLQQIGYQKVTVYQTINTESYGYPLKYVGKYPAMDEHMARIADYMLAVHNGTKGVSANIQRMHPSKVRIITLPRNAKLRVIR